MDLREMLLAQFPAFFLLSILFLIAHLRVRRRNAVKSVLWVLLFGAALAVSILFCFLGMTPQHLLEYFRNRRRLRPSRNPSPSEQSAEDAGNRAKMEEKIRRTTTGQTAITDDDPDAFEREAPLGAVRVVTPAPAKKSPEERLAPMPIPPTDPNHGEQPFIPSIVNKALE